MRLKFAGLLVLLPLACAAVASCKVTSAPRAAAAVKAATPTGGVKPSDKAFDQYVAATRDHLYGEKFELLEVTASRLRSGKERFPGGMWKLNAFYTGLGQPPSGDDAGESEWQLHLGKLRKWAGQARDSVTARVGLGDALVNYAMAARGQGYASTVSAEGWRLFEARNAQAESALDEARGLAVKCPHWYVAKLRVGLGQGWEASRFEEVFKEGVALEPTYYYLYRVKAMYLLPRWHGESGDWERFAEETYRRVGGEEGAMLYYLIGSHIRTYYGMSFFERTRASWPRMLEGFV
ncbi:MAG TPA: hypothetical protein VM899_05485, partial [Rubellimicrobium sp.]|nr:hypothetical protein [Rubellimicrobium sp.]